MAEHNCLLAFSVNYHPVTVHDVDVRMSGEILCNKPQRRRHVEIVGVDPRHDVGGQAGDLGEAFGDGMGLATIGGAFQSDEARGTGTDQLGAAVGGYASGFAPVASSPSWRPANTSPRVPMVAASVCSKCPAASSKPCAPVWMRWPYGGPTAGARTSRTASRNSAPSMGSSACAAARPGPPRRPVSGHHRPQPVRGAAATSGHPSMR